MTQVTDQWRGPGSWTVDLVDGTPPDVRRELALTAGADTGKGMGLLVVTPQRVDLADHPPAVYPLSADPSLLLAAQWAGVILDTDSRRSSLSGEGLLAYLGTSGGGHVHMELAHDEVVDYAHVIVEALLEGGEIGLSDKVDIDTIVPTALQAGTIHGGLTYPQHFGGALKTVREWLVEVSTQAGRGWRIRPTGHLDWGLRGELWPGTPRLVVGRLPAEDDPRWVTLRVDGEWAEDAEHVIDAAVTWPEGEGSPWSTPFPVKRAFSGVFRGEGVWRMRVVDPSGDEASSDWLTRAADVVADDWATRITAPAMTGTLTPRTHVDAGEPLWIYDPEAGLEDPTHTITYAGELIHPVASWVEAITWPITRGSGVYVMYVDRSADPLRILRTLDLTDWVAWPDDETVRIEVGAPAPTL